MISRNTEPNDEPTGSSVDDQAKANVEFAWKSHSAQENWTSKVDTKASVFFTVNVAGVVALVALRTQTDGLLALHGGWRPMLVDIGILACACALLLAGAAIFPLLGPASVHKTQHDAIYFGHLRHRKPDDLAKQLTTLTTQDQVEQLSRQLIVMSKGNWFKHRLLQLALLVAAAGYGVIFVVVMLT